MPKCQDEIGPVCMRRLRNRTIRTHCRIEHDHPDMFAEENDDQRQDETTDECIK